MWFYRHKKGQSMLEYAILLAIIIAAVLVMQTYVKRGFQGGLKDSADKIGDQFSLSDSSAKEDRNMTVNQVIVEEVATTASGGIADFTTATLEGAFDSGAYVVNKRTGGDATSESWQKTESATQEDTRWAEHEDHETSFLDFDDPYR